MFKSFAAAINGLLIALKTERNVQIHGVIAIFVFFLGKWLQLIRFEMAIIWICFAMVMGAELLNTSIEKLCDKVESKEDPQIKIIKDVAAGAVLFISICAAVIGLYIILPKFLDNI
ncbi:diacylglycerol kinase family protein [Bacteroidia bacterium]|jgi:diacylglycerol kinase|nr:diacylglycerol kinase family protein [Bacteroidia bacterium]